MLMSFFDNNNFTHESSTFCQSDDIEFFEIHFREFDDSVSHTNELYGDCIFWLHFNCEVSINVCCRFLSRKFSCDGNFNIKP